MADLALQALLQQALLLSGGAALVLALGPLLRRRWGAAAGYAAWLLVPALLLTPALPRPAQEPVPVWLGNTQAGPLARPVATVQPRGPGAGSLLLAAWLAGTAVVLAVQTRRQRRLGRTAAPLPAGSSPALVGLLRPRLLLPQDFEQRFTAAERPLILAHEAVHRRRHDNAWNALACALTALHWWNPLAWLAWRRLRADQELACDAAVLAAHPGAAADYTRALLAAHDLRPLAAPLASRWGSTHPLVERIDMLTHHRRLTRLTGALLGATLLCTAGLGYALQGTAPAADERKAELKLDISYRTGQGATTTTLRSQPTLQVRLGQQATVMLNGTPDQPTPDTLAIAVVARDLGDDRIELQAEVSKGSPLTVVSRPRLITHNGVKALIEQGQRDPAAGELLSLAITPTLLGDAAPAGQPGTR